MISAPYRGRNVSRSACAYLAYDARPSGVKRNRLSITTGPVSGAWRKFLRSWPRGSTAMLFQPLLATTMQAHSVGGKADPSPPAATAAATVPGPSGCRLVGASPPGDCRAYGGCADRGDHAVAERPDVRLVGSAGAAVEGGYRAGVVGAVAEDRDDLGAEHGGEQQGGGWSSGLGARTRQT